MGSEYKNMLNSYDKATKKVRSTVNAIVDEASFVELDAFMGGSDELGEIRGEGVMCGLASIGGVDVAVFADNPDVFDGGISLRGAEKIRRLIDRAVESGLPLVSLIDTAGARVLEGVGALYGYGLILDGYAEAYGSVPVITVVKGRNYGMLSYLSGLSDLFIAYDKAQIATASPLLLSAAGGDCSSAKTHYEKSGAVTNIVGGDGELRELLIKVLGDLSSPVQDTADDPNRVCKKLTASSSVRDVLAEAFDAGSVVEIRGGIADNVVTAFARLCGVTTAVVGVDGKLTAKGASKITDFLNTASSFGIPVVNLVTSTGIVVDAHQEQCCLMRNISDMIYAYGNVQVPKIALVCGEAVGAAYSIFASKSSYDYTMAWDCASVTPLESAAAARMLYGDDIAKAKDQEKAEAKFAEVYAEDNSAVKAAEKGHFDTVLLPAHTRQYLIAALRVAAKG